MYAFYACQATKTPFPLPKQFVTILQMVQFVVIGCHAGWNLAHPNVAWPVLIAWTEFWLIINMLVLFGNFFYQSYVAVKKKGGAKDE
jgi:elongation of very long chain fatty acids protein 4